VGWACCAKVRAFALSVFLMLMLGKLECFLWLRYLEVVGIKIPIKSVGYKKIQSTEYSL
jgi:hypothetical protein